MYSIDTLDTALIKIISHCYIRIDYRSFFIRSFPFSKTSPENFEWGKNLKNYNPLVNFIIADDNLGNRMKVIRNLVHTAQIMTNGTQH